MFLENDFARPLFDFEKGGKPSAYKCLVCFPLETGSDDPLPCKKITRTERGMRMHLKTVHGWEEQACLYSTDKPTEGKSEERKRNLRLFTPENIAATTKRSLTPATDSAVEAPAEQLQPTELEKSDVPLLISTSEEK